MAERYGNCITKFTSEGDFITSWGGVSHPRYLVVDRLRGHVWVNEYTGHRMHKFSLDGVSLMTIGTIGSFCGSEGIAVDLVGDVYFCDTWNYCVLNYSSDGNFIRSWGSRGSGPGKFEDPREISIDSEGNIYVADRGNDCIQKFTSDLDFITMWGSRGTGPGEFQSPARVRFDSEGNIYVVDRGNHRIQMFTSDGDFITMWGSYGSDNGKFTYPGGITVNSEGFIYVVETVDENRICMFRPARGRISCSAWAGFTGALAGEMRRI